MAQRGSSEPCASGDRYLRRGCAPRRGKDALCTYVPLETSPGDFHMDPWHRVEREACRRGQQGLREKAGDVRHLQEGDGGKRPIAPFLSSVSIQQVD